MDLNNVFGLILGPDLKNRAAHLHQEFPGVTPPPPQKGSTKAGLRLPRVSARFEFRFESL